MLGSNCIFVDKPAVMKLFRLILFPFSLLYGLGVMVRNLAFDLGLIRSREFDLPVISVGNLSVGGAGKSPMTEYLVRLLKGQYKIATLSRGYGRKSRGFLQVETDFLSTRSGDEPLQFKRKFPDITVAVCEKRAEGIRCLEKDHQMIILDDAYQHRMVRPGLSILLFDYNRIFDVKLLLPAGDLREPVWEKDRADLIVVTKTPQVLNLEERQKIIKAIGPHDWQELFFSYLRYGDLIPFAPGEDPRKLFSLKISTRILLLTGIVNPAPLVFELGGYTQYIIHQRYPDHHNFTRKNIIKLVSSFNELGGSDRLIITTEKDAQRLRAPELAELLSGLPVYYLPVEAEIHQPEKRRFDELIRKYAAELTVDD